MAEKDNTFQNTVEALFRGMDSFITTKTVVGEAETFLPVSRHQLYL